MYANKLSQIILIFILIISFLSYGSGKGIYATNINKDKAEIGLPSKPSSPSIQKTTTSQQKNTGSLSSNAEKKKSNELVVIPSKVPVHCDAECKIDQLIALGIRSEIASSLVINCKALADNPVHCIKFGASLVKNESGGGYKCRSRNQYNCSGMDVSAQYKSFNDGILHWIGKYNKYWYKANDMSFFYSVEGSLPPSRYCTSEDSSGSDVGCPYGLRNSSSFFNKITF